jgi:hypothetical protein
VCIKQSGCDLMITTSAQSSGPGVSGTSTIDPLGGFTNGAIKEGTTQRTGCLGVWDQTKSELTIACGGNPGCVAANTQCCSITLVPHQGGC